MPVDDGFVPRLGGLSNEPSKRGKRYWAAWSAISCAGKGIAFALATIRQKLYRSRHRTFPRARRPAPASADSVRAALTVAVLDASFRGAGGNTVMRPTGTIAICVFVFTALGPASTARAHPGGLNAQGCHQVRKTGGYHCYGGGRSSSSRSSEPKGIAFRNCSAARAAGAAPVRAKDPGYGRHLDRDGDGIGCE